MIPALCFFLAGAAFGIYMLLRHLKRQRIPGIAAVAHGLAGATGFLILLVTIVRSPGLTLARYSLVILILAIVLGAVNLLFHLRKVRHRTALILAHGLTAVAGVSTLLYGIAVYASSGTADAEREAPSVVSTSASASASAATLASRQEPSTPPTTPVPNASAAPTASAARSASADSTAPALRPGRPWPDLSVTFEGDSSVLTSSARTSLAPVAEELTRHTEVTLVEVQGYADERGDDAHNLALTQARAAAVVDALVNLGINRSRLRSAGYGARCPADPDCRKAPAPSTCHQPSSWQRDRRVELLVLEAGRERFHGSVTCDRGASLVPARDQAYVGR